MRRRGGTIETAGHALRSGERQEITMTERRERGTIGTADMTFKMESAGMAMVTNTTRAGRTTAMTGEVRMEIDQLVAGENASKLDGTAIVGTTRESQSGWRIPW
jgi:hypothetical protein